MYIHTHTCTYSCKYHSRFRKIILKLFIINVLFLTVYMALHIFIHIYIYQNWVLINILIQVPGCICDVGFSWCSLFLLWAHCAFISVAGTTTIVLLEKDLLVILVNCVLHNYSSQSHFSWSICSAQVLFPYLITQRV